MNVLKLELTKFDGAVISEGFVCIPLPQEGTGAKGIFHAKSGRVYVDCVMWENDGGVDDYGNSGSVQMSLSKEEREAGGKGAYIGNTKVIGNN